MSFLCKLCGIFLFLPIDCGALSKIGLAAEELSAPGWQLQGLTIELSDPDLARLTIGADKVRVGTRYWQAPKIVCRKFIAQKDVLYCALGILQTASPIPFNFSAHIKQKKFELTLLPKPQEVWRAGVSWTSGWQAQAHVRNGEITRLAPWLPAALPPFSGGQLNGTVQVIGRGKNIAQAQVNIGVAQLKFSDANGLHAGEKISGNIDAKIYHRDAGWNWQSTAIWSAGEVFWQPWYAKAAHHVEARGSADENFIRVDQGNVSWAGIGKAEFSGVWQRLSAKWHTLNFAARDVDVGALHTNFLAPSLRQPTLAKLKARGRADVAFFYRNGQTESAELILRDGVIEDAEQRFILTGIDLRLPWAQQTAKQGDIRLKSLRVAKLEGGPIETQVQTRGDQLTIKTLSIPLLDGKLKLTGLEVSKTEKGWQAELSGELTPVSLQQLTPMLGLPVMHGELSGKIPRISYRDENLRTEGNLTARVFDGVTTVKNFSVDKLFGNVPIAKLDVDMRNLDLALLTQAFSFGTMEGRIDVNIEGLQMANWQPVKFDASLQSSQGRYPKKISQRAVQNISALGGAGPAAAIQRSFLSFFEQFGYNRLALSCQLRDGICNMGGIEPKGAGFVIVEGGGIPAITVLGYNREVSWQELVDRLGRITKGGANSMKQIEKE